MNASPELSWRWLVAWQGAALLLLLLTPLAVFGDWPWEMTRRELLPFALLVAAFGASCVLQQAARHWLANPQRYVAAVLGTIAIFAGALLLLLLARSAASRTLLLAALAIAVVVLPLPLAHRRFELIGIGVLAMAIVGAGVIGLKKHQRDRNAALQTTESYVSTNLYNLSVLTHAGRIPYPAVRGGGFTKIGDRPLLGTGDGHLYLLSPGEDSIEVAALPYRVPLNGEAFAAAVGREYREPARSSEYGAGAPPGVQTWRFRAADVLAQDIGDGIRLFASHHYWHNDRKCFVLRVSTLTIDSDGSQRADEPWKTVFETTPCLPLSGPDAKRGKNPFQGEEIGGRMELLDERTLLLTVGDMGFSGLESWQRLAQDPSASYGKTIRIHLDSGASEVFTLGHRNPQGLYIDPNGDIWETEHGSKGGDELNLLVEGTNYGWPNVTYGTEYRSFVWPLNPQQGHHEGYPKPVYAWVPSIGITSIIKLAGSSFSSWKDDYLVGSLSTRSLYRIRIHERRVIFVEPIAVGQRVRDMIELDDGRILVWTDTAALLEIAPAEGMNGALLFGSLCETCHWVQDGLSHRSGPDLYGIVDNEVADAPGFVYSPALQQLGGRWTAETLDRFLADPQAVAPGTSMAFEGIDDEKQRALIIEHLRKTNGR